MKYVKLVAKPGTWFKEGTEVYNYDCNPPKELCRVSLREWELVVNDPYGFTVICVRGIHEGKWDGEACSADEFEVEIVEDRV